MTAPTTRETADHAELAACPFCGGAAEIVHIEEGENQGGSCVCCTACQASGNLEFGRKENFTSNWNRRRREAALLSEIAALRGERNEAHQKYVDANEARIDAERQRDELHQKYVDANEARIEAVGLLREWHPATSEAYRDHSLEARTEAFLANQGTEQ